MKDMKQMPAGKVYLTPGQRQARYIRMLGAVGSSPDCFLRGFDGFGLFTAIK